MTETKCAICGHVFQEKENVHYKTTQTSRGHRESILADASRVITVTETICAICYAKETA
jgi:hypothetical protein